MSDSEGLFVRLQRTLCSSGGHMELGKLQQSLGMTSERMERLVEVEAGRSLVIREQKDEGRVAVYRSALRMCAQQPPTCGEDCQKLHLCRYYVLGSCSRSPCKFNHSIQTARNLQILQRHNLEHVRFMDLQQILLQNDPGLLPDVCRHYNHGGGPHGSCNFKESCNKLHMCQHYLQDDCMFGSKCKRSHDLQEAETLKKLTKWGLSGSYIPRLLETYRNAHALAKNPALSPTQVKTPAKPRKPTAQAAPLPKPIEEICLYFILNTCSFKDRCVRDHFHLPYRWQLYEDGTWEDLDPMETIEKLYCDPNSSVAVDHLDFHTMTYKSFKVRRLSTPSSVSKPPHFIFATDWLWYWKDDYNTWIEYGSKNDLHKSATVTSTDLEKTYLSDNTAEVNFHVGKYRYELNFKDMIQKSRVFGTERKVCRRPRFVSKEDVTKKKTRKVKASKEDDESTPKHWDKGHVPDVGYKMVQLMRTSEEYKTIEKAFRRTLPSINISSIQRIQNFSLWQVYQWQKEQMKKQNGGQDVDERQLFHGTDSKWIDAICQQNFDWRICGSHGTAYGKGSYFARDSSYSHSYSKRHGSETLVMFVARVLVGESTRGHSAYLRPPSKSSSSSASFYDSCVDNERNPSIFVIFEKHQIYPEYLIRYSER
ncbi:protein mono-ADP-ribosyltransferase PARP12-like [Spea bombifrons]|uniref:protein mono-ADP-ribosyltransferase PARP12-like n=1 Tax=Spea bombifrons TaxID=233779 RepID=UPI002348F5AA|nr:protein mono-ADP-ribosyltransferase PARP12-like [Spea bombifrons]XP_053319349.1 protein mono-ADP-ribosyltransferase PARP12-like [Spea bombifrons]XP_053319350.1 protein mono-ADP-ribosyltransferase PARP12-like [Spea bombifrons]